MKPRTKSRLRCLRLRNFRKFRPACPQAAELDPDERDQYWDTIGRHTLDSILLASAPDAVLWSDDPIIGILAEADFQTRRVWTQPILRRLFEEGIVVGDEFHRATTELVGWYYQGTFWDANTIVADANLAVWHPDPRSVSSILTSIDSSETGLRIAAEAIRLVWRSGVGGFTRQAFLFAILGRYDNLSIIQRIGRIVAGAFALDVTGATEVERLIQIWLLTTPILLRP